MFKRSSSLRAFTVSLLLVFAVLSLTATDSWFTVSGSASTNQVFIPVDPSRINVFSGLHIHETDGLNRALKL